MSIQGIIVGKKLTDWQRVDADGNSVEVEPGAFDALYAGIKPALFDDQHMIEIPAYYYRAAELLGTPGFTPFDPQNLCEALCETDDQAVTRLADLLREGDTAAAGQALEKLTRDYWEAAARSEAERQINKEAENHPCAGCSSRRCSSCDA